MKKTGVAAWVEPPETIGQRSPANVSAGGGGASGGAAAAAGATNTIKPTETLISRVNRIKALLGIDAGMKMVPCLAAASDQMGLAGTGTLPAQAEAILAEMYG